MAAMTAGFVAYDNGRNLLIMVQSFNLRSDLNERISDGQRSGYGFFEWALELSKGFTIDEGWQDSSGEGWQQLYISHGCPASVGGKEFQHGCMGEVEGVIRH